MARQIDILFDPDRQVIVQSFDYLAGGEDFQQARLPKFMLGDDYRLNLYAPATFSGWTTATGKVGIGLPPGVATGPTQGDWYAEYDSDITAGPLVSGKTYIIASYEAGDNFSNVGGANSTGSRFVATGTTPTTWSNGSVLHETTADIAWNASATEVKTAFDALNILSGTFSVSGEGPWILIYSLTTNLEAFLIGAQNLEPQCNGSSTVRQAGNGTDTREKFVIVLQQAVSASTTGFTNIPTTNAANVVTNPQNGGAGLNEIFVLDLPNFPYAGSFTLTTSNNATNNVTVPLSFGADEEEMVEAIEATGAYGANSVSVRKTGSYRWEIEAIGGKANTAMPNITASTAGLTFAVGRYVDLPLNTDNMIAAVGARASRPMTFELELTISGDIETPIQEPVTVVNDVFDPTSTTSSPSNTPLTLSDIGYTVPAWRYDITELEGGDPDCLDAVTTADKSPGYRIDILLGGVIRAYVLTAGTTATAAPGIIRGLDYASSTNEKFWTAS